MSQALAYDRSLRHRDAFGRMRVELTNISKANVCPYFGREIPNHAALGLDANKVYRLYRHPDELEKAAPTFDMVPVMDEHVVVNAGNPEKDYIAGTTGSGAKFVFPYLKVPMAVWVGDSIDDVRQQKKRQLSCGYTYRADMTPGVTREGIAYDGVMRDIMGNHVALVREGRAGPDVMVADEMPAELSQENTPMKQQTIVESVLTVLGVTTATAEQKAALDSALDAAMCTATQKAAAAAKEEAATDAAAKAKKLKDEEEEEARKNPKGASDAALSPDAVTKADAEKLAADAASAAVTAERALVAARADVTDIVGAVALDSAEGVYRFALKESGVPGHDTIHESALPALWAQVKAGKVAKAGAADAALDATPATDVKALVSAIGL